MVRTGFAVDGVRINLGSPLALGLGSTLRVEFVINVVFHVVKGHVGALAYPTSHPVVESVRLGAGWESSPTPEVIWPQKALCFRISF